MSEYRPRRKYDRDFKLEAVRLITERGRTIKVVADELGIHPNMLSRWRRQFIKEQEHAFPGKGHLTPLEEEVCRLKKELSDVKEERDILKKAMAVFSRPPE